MSILNRFLVIVAAISSVAGIVYATGFASPPVAQAESTAVTGAIPALGTMILVATGSVGLFIGKLLPRRKG